MKKESLKKAYAILEQESGFHVGDIVRVLRKAAGFELGWDDTWSHHMDEFVGKKAKVVEAPNRGIGLLLSVKGVLGMFYFPYFVLEKISSNGSKLEDLKEAYLLSEKDCKFKRGDRVRVLRKARAFELGWGTYWSEDMDELVDKVGVVERGVSEDETAEGIIVNFHDYPKILGTFQCYLPFFVLEKLLKRAGK